jgi:hypothetical protein
MLLPVDVLDSRCFRVKSRCFRSRCFRNWCFRTRSFGATRYFSYNINIKLMSFYTLALDLQTLLRNKMFCILVIQNKYENHFILFNFFLFKDGNIFYHVCFRLVHMKWRLPGKSTEFFNCFTGNLHPVQQ